MQWSGTGRCSAVLAWWSPNRMRRVTGIQVHSGISHSLSGTLLLLQELCQLHRNMELGLHCRAERGMDNALEAILPRGFCQMGLLLVSLSIFFGRCKWTLRVKLGILELIPEWVFSSITRRLRRGTFSMRKSVKLQRNFTGCSRTRLPSQEQNPDVPLWADWLKCYANKWMRCFFS